MISVKSVGLITAISIAVANIVGTGIFTSLGYQLEGTKTPFAILMLWIIGGIAALAGALSYAEIATRLPAKSGGEYYFLTRIFHPYFGYTSGWISVFAGFGATMAAVSIAMGSYLYAGLADIFTGLHSINEHYFILAFGTFAVISISIVNMINVRFLRWFQNSTGLLKILIIIVFVILGLIYGDSQGVSFYPNHESWNEMLTYPFAASLVYVMFTYSGWECATYITGEIRNYKKVLPIALITSTVFVVVLYVLINIVFLSTTPEGAMTGKVEIATIVAQHIMGSTGGIIISLLLVLTLVSTLNSNTWAGSRVIQSMGEDHPSVKYFGKTHKNLPKFAIVFQLIIVILFIFTNSFNSLLIYIGLLLSISQFLTVFGLFVLRYKKIHIGNDFYKTPLYPLPPLLFLGILGWMIYSTVIQNPIPSLEGFATLLIAGILYYFERIRYPNHKITTIADDKHLDQG